VVIKRSVSHLNFFVSSWTSNSRQPHDKYHKPNGPHIPPAPRYLGYDEYRQSHAWTHTCDDAYRSHDPEEFSRRDQESFMKGYIEASLDTLCKDDMITWYKSVDSYCTLHSFPLLSFQQVRKGVDLYPANAPTDHRECFSWMLSIKLTNNVCFGGGGGARDPRSQ
jgi:hypothetical protein